MARVKKPVTKLTAMHHIGYGAGDAGGVLMLMVISYLERFSRNILGIDPSSMPVFWLFGTFGTLSTTPWLVLSWTSPSPRLRTRQTSSVPGSCAPSPSWQSVWVL